MNNFLEKYKKIYEEREFIESFKKSLHQEFWEMVISGYLVENGFDLQKKANDDFLDFFFCLEDYKVHIEATAP